MKIGILSDTHDHHANVLKAIELFNDRRVDYVLHAGDIVSPFTARAFDGLRQAKFIAVFGNNEGERLFMKQVIDEIGAEIHDDCFKGQIAGKKIFMTHRDAVVDELAASGKFDIVIYGHTHKRDIRNIGNTLVINPGETTDWITGQAGVVILDLETLEIETALL